MPIHNAGDWDRKREGEGTEALQCRTTQRGGTELSGIDIYHPRVHTRRGRPSNDRKRKAVKSRSDWVLRKRTEWVGDRPTGDQCTDVYPYCRSVGHAKSRHRFASRWCRPNRGSRDCRYERVGASLAWRGNS